MCGTFNPLLAGIGRQTPGMRPNPLLIDAPQMPLLKVASPGKSLIKGTYLATTDLIVLTKSRFSNSAIAVGKAPTPGRIKPSADSITVKSGC